MPVARIVVRCNLYCTAAFLGKNVNFRASCHEKDGTLTTVNGWVWRAMADSAKREKIAAARKKVIN